MQETQETRVQSLGWEDLLEEEIVIHSSILPEESPWPEESVGFIVHGVTQSRTRLK